MKFIYYILIFKVLISIPLAGQNLVENGDFEIFDHCPKTYRSMKHFLPYWYSPTKGTPDYFNRCSKGIASVPDNFAGSLNSENGDGYVGFGVANLTHMIGLKKHYSREYISTKLIVGLKKDSLYRLSFIISHSQYSKISVIKISAYLSKRKVNKAITKELKLTPQINFDLSIVPKENWVLLSAVYKASGEERFLTIGNFQSDNDLVWSKSEIQENRKSPFDIGAYYYIDDVVLIPVDRIQLEERDFTRPPPPTSPSL